FPLGASDTQDVGLSKFTESALKVYGSYVVENRAVPDFRDGLKPSHRAVLWSMVGLGLRPSGGCKKTARTVGDVIGKYHPHGDKSSHDAMATIVITVPPFVGGQGGWGSPNTPPAAMRYSEAKLSKFAHAFLVDPEYLKVVPYEPNFSNDDVLPLYLPALLPTLLFVTSIPAPAYSVRAGNPAFSLRAVADSAGCHRDSGACLLRTCRQPGVLGTLCARRCCAQVERREIRCTAAGRLFGNQASVWLC